MRVLFIHFGPFDCNSGIQALHFGEGLARLGWEVTLACEGATDRVKAFGEPGFECISHEGLPAKLRQWRSRPEESLVCAWTPRENVRRATLPFAEDLGVPYVVHLEDNEDRLLSSAAGRPVSELRRLPAAAQEALALRDLAHPSLYPEFVAGASGVTVITEELNEFNSAARPHHLARPGIDLERFRPDLAPAVPRRALGLGDDDFVLVYHGHVHYANQHEMLSLYLAVKLLRRRGLAVKLVRIGHTRFGGVDQRSAEALTEGVIELGPIPWRLIPGHLALADAFVQPGAPDDFNRYRLPSKLPEFLAMGRPVLLPHCNIGNDLVDGRNASLLEQGRSLEIAARLQELIGDRELARRLGEGAREFAAAELRWENASMALGGFYEGIIASDGATAV